MSEHNPTMEPTSGDAIGNGRPIEENLASKATWMRLLFMVICCVLVSISSFVGSFVVVFGFIWLLFTGEVNRQIQQVGQSLASYIYQNIRYLTFNTEELPFPMGGEWPPGSAD